jgi:hypothetical protein
MNYVPILVFLLAVAWMIRQGYAAKKKYQHDHKNDQALQ